MKHGPSHRGERKTGSEIRLMPKLSPHCLSYALKVRPGGLFGLVCLLVCFCAVPALSGETGFRKTVTDLSALGDRATGTAGAVRAGEYIRRAFESLGFDKTGVYSFSIPVLQHGASRLTLTGRNLTVPIHPLTANAVTPEAIPEPGLEGPVHYVGSGELNRFNGKEIEGSVVLMELDSGRNWLHAANLGAKALIYIDRGPTSKAFFNEKMELSPVQFPRFWMSFEEASELFGDFTDPAGSLAASRVRLSSEAAWREVTAENIYLLITGTNPDLADDLLMVEAFYDGSSLVPGLSPAADQACGIATLIELARTLKQSPPARPVLLAATSGHDQALAGLRDMAWILRSRSTELRRMKKELRDYQDTRQKYLETIRAYEPGAELDEQSYRVLLEAVSDRIKTEVDLVSRELMRLRLARNRESSQELIKELADRRLLLRNLGWRTEFGDISQAEIQLLSELAPQAARDQQEAAEDADRRLGILQSAMDFREMVQGGELKTVISLHLSSHGDGLGAFNRGWLFPLRQEINRVANYSEMDELLRRTAGEVESRLGMPGFFKDTLRPSRLTAWDSFLPDKPQLGGEVTALAGYLGLTLATVNDARASWGTPYDTPDRLDWDFALRQNALVCGLLRELAAVPSIPADDLPPNGLSWVTGRAKFIRHGELFPDQPAPGTVILAYQGLTRFYAMVDSSGTFMVKGVADKKHVLDKVILEGYKFEPETGRVVWAIDKAQTGKDAYRLKIERRSTETNLVMFAGKQTTLFDLLEPRSFASMTKIQLIDGRLETEPMRFWYSRIDTRDSTLTSICLEPGTRLKMTLSDSMLSKKMILLNSSTEEPEGAGYLVDDWPAIHRTQFMVARDMWTLLGPRMANLERHGIHNEKIKNLRQEGETALQKAASSLADRKYDDFSEASARSWALASRVYDNVEKTQKDVLFGVLFYIALFVPFAFCLERFLLSYVDIHKRIIAFLAILLILIAVIYKVHPAFQLAYSPTVVILAFFIMGLSLIVTLIIFFRFEEEMVLLQKRANQMLASEISRWQAFVSAFLLGVSNLRRRRLRTVLTCVTLIILTFTIMSFTSVQTLRHVSRVLFQDSSPYQGFLLKNADWRDLPPEALSTLVNAFEDMGPVAPRVWLEAEGRTRATIVPVSREGKTFQAQGVVGLASAEPMVTGLDKVLVGGRWIAEDERRAVILPDRMAVELGINPQAPSGQVFIYGLPFEVVGVFSGQALDAAEDLDGEPVTPAFFPSESSLALTEVEVEAMESGEEVQAFQGRYQHVSGDLTVIVPYRTLLALGGKLKGFAAKPRDSKGLSETANDLVDRFRLTIFLGERDGTYLYQASDTLSYSGVPNIVIPVLITVFIVLNTMIGSVYERKKEIGIYTSVGLAPSHVSFLFIAEAMAFAVLSVVLGYLFAQATASIFAGTALWSGITVNYSSLAGVAAMLLIFLVVLVSVIYPSRVAAQIAIPDVRRSWTLPGARDNSLEVSLPVLVKYREFLGLGGYIHAYFTSHKDVSHGIFSTGEMEIHHVCENAPSMDDEAPECVPDECGEKTCLQFSLQVWLAPFDFGIMQRVYVTFTPSGEDPGFLEIKIRLIRQAGEANAWRRVNKAFLNQLRKRILIWRSLKPEAQRHYEKTFGAAGPDSDLESES